MVEITLGRRRPRWHQEDGARPLVDFRLDGEMGTISVTESLANAGLPVPAAGDRQGLHVAAIRLARHYIELGYDVDIFPEYGDEVDTIE